MYIRAFVLLTFLSTPAWGQHPGHQPAPPLTGQPKQVPDGPVLKINDAVKASQATFRNLEKAARSGDEARLDEPASRYEESLDDLIRSVDASQGDRSYAKNLDLSQRSLSRQLQQLQQLASTAPPSTTERFTRLTDAVTIGLDNVLAQQESLRTAAPANAIGAHGGSGHGCGGGILRRPFFFLRGK